MTEKKLNILGTDYTLYEDVPEAEDKYLSIRDGYTDRTVKKIVIVRPTDEWEIADREYHIKEVKRHEIIHAYMYESGLDQHTNWDMKEGQPHPEQIVEWFAMQFPKILKTFQEADAL